MRRVIQIGVLCAISILSAVTSYGQAVNGTLLGTVTDSSGAVVPNAKVTATEVNTGISRSGQTNESGNYALPDLTPGHYAVTVDAAGFKKEMRKDIDLIVNSSTRVDIQLQPGAITEVVEVTGAPPLLQTDRADTGLKIETAQIMDMPLGANRNFQTLLNLVPGTTKAQFQHSQFFNASSALQTEVDGQMREGNCYQIEGIDDNERTGLMQILIPPIEAIETVDVSTSNFEAELGRASGANTNVILKSGANVFHGAAYEFLQNTDLDARSFFNPSRGAVHYNYFGGNASGAIKKNKLFFFGDYLKVMDHEAVPANGSGPVTVPSMAFRTGDLSAAPTIIYDPSTGNPDGTGRTPFAGNQIPSTRINPVSAAILALVPAPNLPFTASKPANNYAALLPFSKDTDSFDVKFDDNFTEKDRLSGRFSFARPVTYQAPVFGMAGGPGPGSAFMGTGSQKTYSTGLNYVRIFSPSLVSEFRVGVAHYHNEALPSDYGANDASALGIPGVNLDPWTSGIVGINLQTSFSDPLIGYSASMPWKRAEVNGDATNTWTAIRGNHTIKWGVDLRRLRDDLLQTQTFSPRGVYDFSGAQTSIPGAANGFGNNFASFLLDQPSLVGRDLATYFPTYRAWQFFAFGQDKWLVTPKLTLDIGVRWEFYPPAVAAFPGEFSNYDPVSNTLVIAGIGGNPANLGMKTHYDYFAPRIGIAYRLSSSTVIRTGFGISYTPFPDNKYAWDNYPIKGNNQYSPAGAGYGPAVLANGQPATFQAGFPLPVPFTIPSDGIIANPPASSAYEVIPLDFKNPYVESWNFSVQQALPWRFTLDVAYVGNHGVHTVSASNINAATVVGLGTAGQPEYPRTANTTLYWQGFSSMYNALQVKLNRRLAAGLLVTTSYTWGKAMNFQGDDDSGLMFYINEHRNWARADFNRTQTFVQSYVYDLPVGHGHRWLSSGPAASILGGWQLNGILSLMTGLPFTVSYSAANLKAPNNSQTADENAPIQILHGINTGNPWFSTTSFQAPTGLNFGNTGRNYLTGPGFFDLDASLFKTIQIKERAKLEFRAEAFSLTNTPQFNNPGSTLGSSTFGYVTSTLGSGSGVNGVGGGRAVQLGAKLSF
jgi:hypothetical protein